MTVLTVSFIITFAFDKNFYIVFFLLYPVGQCLSKSLVPHSSFAGLQYLDILHLHLDLKHHQIRHSYKKRQVFFSFSRSYFAQRDELLFTTSYISLARTFIVFRNLKASSKPIIGQQGSEQQGSRKIISSELLDNSTSFGIFWAHARIVMQPSMARQKNVCIKLRFVKLPLRFTRFQLRPDFQSQAHPCYYKLQ